MQTNDHSGQSSLDQKCPIVIEPKSVLSFSCAVYFFSERGW